MRLQPGEGLVEALHLRHTFAVDVAEYLFHADRALCGVAEARIRGLEDLRSVLEGGTAHLIEHLVVDVEATDRCELEPHRAVQALGIEERTVHIENKCLNRKSL